jgi:phospholipid/cholesterol/gamma-HCH transport system substrate-binding protein
MRRQSQIEVKVGLFLTAGLGLIMMAILLLGGTQDLFRSKNLYSAHFKNVEGLIKGAKVILGGVSVGAVEDIVFDKAQRDIVVHFGVRKDSADFVRKDSSVEIATQGVLGDKYINVVTGSLEQPALPSGAELPNRPSRDLGQFLTKSDQLVVSLNSIAVTLDRILKNFESENKSEAFFKGLASSSKNLSQATEKLNQQMDNLQVKAAVSQLNQIFEKINNGTGTLGGLVNDPSLYDELKALMGGANRNRVLRNLVRQTIKNTGEAEGRAQPIENK